MNGKPITPEHESKRWAAYGLGPRLARIESAFDADPQFFGPGSRVHPEREPERLTRQADLYREAAEAFSALPRRQQFAFTTWGLRDLESWRKREDGADAPLLFDVNGNPKPAAAAWVQGLG